MPSVSERLSFVSVKSFGDLVIAVTILARLTPDARECVTLLAGRHLAPLLAALAVPVRVRFLDVPLDGPPALFDARRLGLAAAMRSAQALRGAIGRGLDPDETLVFDVLGVRERYLAHRRPTVALPAASNIYYAYEALLLDRGFTLDPAPTGRSAGDLVRIFAGARMKHRRPSVALIHALVDQVTAYGARAELVLLDGERRELEQACLPIIVIPRKFDAMCDAVERADAVISPDSMTAHLAEHCKKPVLVITPEQKFYWMPRFAARHGTISLFDENLATGPFEKFMTHYVAG